MGKRTHVLLCLDASGSMDSIKNEAIELFNAEVDKWQNARPEDVGEVTCSLMIFGTESRPVLHYVAEPVERVQKLTAATYVPDGGTPLRDAVGMLCSRVEQELIDSDDDYGVYAVIISDGCENFSGKWQLVHHSSEPSWSSERLAELLKRLQAGGRWTINYLGANQDLTKISQEYGIPLANTRSWQNTSKGTRFAAQDLGAATQSYMMCRSMNMTAANNLYEGKPASE